ncbi:MAG: uroporphyrinogen-III synthase [Deltaproteobacteria bacterium]|nr:uroporphyrinogen-III synthase [Deltaproteobacteria bacterium]MBN2672370.1 uroporphyrinogen-III synthase [Deltaproteobacteria bacterium]
MKPNGPRILIGRAGTQAAELQQALESRGARVECVPLIDIVQRPDLEQMKWPDRVDIVVLTSRNTVPAYVTIAAKLSPHFLATVGAKTAEALQTAGFKPNMIGSGKGAAALLDELSARISIQGKSILYPGSNLIGSDFSRQAASQGATVHAVPVYETIIPKQLTAARLANHDIAIFFSSSGAEHFFSLLPPSQVPRMASIAIGAATASTLQRLNAPRIVVSARPDTQGLLDAVNQCKQQQPTECSDDLSHYTA